jgi:hypothetical protein
MPLTQRTGFAAACLVSHPDLTQLAHPGMECSHMASDRHSGRSCRVRGHVFRRFNHLPPTGFVALDTILNHG